MSSPVVIGKVMDDGGLVCLGCADYYQAESLREGETLEFAQAYDIGYPDGYTCATCGDEWYPEGYDHSVDYSA
jgi:hypothetical protein